MAEKNRSHSKINGLPIEIKNQVEQQLLNGHTYEDIATYLGKMGHDVHFTSVGRYGKVYLKKFEAVRMAKEYARLLAEDNIDRPTTELHEANNALISQIIMDVLISEDMPAEEKIKAAQSIATLQSAQVRNEKLKIEARKASGDIHVVMNLLKAKVFETLGNEHPEVSAIMMQIANDIEDATKQGQNAL